MIKRLTALMILICMSAFLFAGCEYESPEVYPSVEVSSPVEISTSVSAPVTEPPNLIMASPSPKEESDEEIRSRIESLYGVTVIWGGDEVFVEPGMGLIYDESPCSTPGLLRKALITLDEQLALYPEGFFGQMPQPYFIMAEWVRTATDGTVLGYADYGKGYTAIFATANEDFLEELDWYGEGDIVGQAGIDFVSTLHHEIGHTVFGMTSFDGANVFDFDRYFEILPDGFVPPVNVNDDSYKKYLPTDDIEQVYFCSLYAMKNPMEFMAELFCLSMKQSLIWTFASPHVQAQLRLFFEAIRDTFNSDGWPEQTYWERALR